MVMRTKKPKYGIGIFMLAGVFAGLLCGCKSSDVKNEPLQWPQQLTESCRLLAQQYPFSRHSKTELSASALEAYLGPKGELEQFEQSLAGRQSQLKITAQQHLLWAENARALFYSGVEPSHQKQLKLQLRPKPKKQAQVQMHLGPNTSLSSSSAQSPYVFKDLAAQPPVFINFDLANSGEKQALAYGGSWPLFRMLDSAFWRRDANTKKLFTLHTTQGASLEFTLDGASTWFQVRSSLHCP